MLIEVSIRLGYLPQDKGIKISELVKSFSKYSKSNIYIHVELPLEVKKTKKRKLNQGRPRLSTPQEKPQITRTFLLLGLVFKFYQFIFFNLKEAFL